MLLRIRFAIRSYELTPPVAANATNYQYLLDSQKLNQSSQNSTATAYSYTPQGHVQQQGNKTLTYAADQRLSQVSQANTVLGQYRYDAQGLRIQKTAGGTTTTYLYDTQNRLIGEQQGTTSKHYAWIDQQPLAQIHGNTATSPIYYSHNNHLGQPQRLTTQTQQTVWQASLDPFGQATLINPSVTQNLRLPGQYFDSETGWHYNQQRHYDPASGRYLQSDPIGLDGGINTYTYVGGDPVNYIDPQGESAGATVAVCTALYTGYKMYKYYESMKNLDEKMKNVRDSLEKDNQAYDSILNGTKMPSGYNENATNDAVRNAAKAAADVVMKGADLPGTSTGGPMSDEPSIPRNPK